MEIRASVWSILFNGGIILKFGDEAVAETDELTALTIAQMIVGSDVPLSLLKLLPEVQLGFNRCNGLFKSFWEDMLWLRAHWKTSASFNTTS